jgi:hypothetical protein
MAVDSTINGRWVDDQGFVRTASGYVISGQGATGSQLDWQRNPDPAYQAAQEEKKAANLAWNTGPDGRIEVYKRTGVDLGKRPSDVSGVSAGDYYGSGAYSGGTTGGSSEIDELTRLLQKLAGAKNSYLSFDEAQQRASSELNPMYEDASARLSTALNADMERRGIYNSPLASGIMTEKQGLLSNEQVAAISERANQLIQNDQTLTLQEKQMQMNTLNALLSSLIGRESNLANIALKEGELLGTYKGQQTLASKAFDLQSATQRLNDALSTVQSLGKVTTQEQADLLGVPVGTPSWQAQNAVAQRQQELQMFNQEMAFKQSSQALQNQTQAANELMANFSKDMTIWETTGRAPDTQALRAYGIVPGTPWSDSAAQSAQRKLEETQAQIGLIQAEEELQFQNRATNFMSLYSVTRGVAEAALLIIDQVNSLADAQKLVNSQKSVLTQEGVNITTLLEALNKYYGQSTTYGGSSTGSTGTVDRSGSWSLNGEPFNWNDWFYQNFGRPNWPADQ